MHRTTNQLHWQVSLVGMLHKVEGYLHIACQALFSSASDYCCKAVPAPAVHPYAPNFDCSTRCGVQQEVSINLTYASAGQLLEEMLDYASRLRNDREDGSLSPTLSDAEFARYKALLGVASTASRQVQLSRWCLIFVSCANKCVLHC